MTKFVKLVCITVALGIPATLVGHHGFSRWFDESKPITLVGTVTRVDWVNPHIYFNIAVTTNGKTEAWAIQTGPPVEMVRLGITKERFKPGMIIKISGHQARPDADLPTTVPDPDVRNRVSASHKAYAIDIQIADK